MHQTYPTNPNKPLTLLSLTILGKVKLQATRVAASGLSSRVRVGVGAGVKGAGRGGAAVTLGAGVRGVMREGGGEEDEGGQGEEGEGDVGLVVSISDSGKYAYSEEGRVKEGGDNNNNINNTNTWPATNLKPQDKDISNVVGVDVININNGTIQQVEGLSVPIRYIK